MAFTIQLTEDEIQNEVWKPIPNHEGYEASDLGRVRSWYKKGNHPQKLSSTPTMKALTRSGRDRRLSFSIRPNKRMYAAVAVLSAFVSPCPDGLEACHNDGNKDNNRLDNLRWDTHSNNMLDRNIHGTDNNGEKHPMAKLTLEQVREIRTAYANGERVCNLARFYNVRHQTISRIIHGHRWAKTL